MIGGYDVVLTSNHQTNDLVFCAAKAILGIWSKGIIELSDFEDKIIQLSELRTGSYNQVFIYRDIESKKSWTKDGWTKENCISMIYLLNTTNDGTITCVVEDPEHYELKEILEAIYVTINTKN
jgi:hypothetical protein